MSVFLGVEVFLDPAFHQDFSLNVFFLEQINVFFQFLSLFLLYHTWLHGFLAVHLMNIMCTSADHLLLSASINFRRVPWLYSNPPLHPKCPHHCGSSSWFGVYHVMDCGFFLGRVLVQQSFIQGVKSSSIDWFPLCCAIFCSRA